MPLRKGDTLVVNASKSAVASHATAPGALEAYLAAGVRVYTSARLHSKVIATSTKAVIGSANASVHSQASSEAVVITAQKSVVHDVRRYVRAEAGYATPITSELLVELHKVWDSGGRGVVPGNNGVSTELRLLPNPLGKLWLAAAEHDDLTSAEREKIEEGVDQVAGFAVEALQLPDNDAFSIGDVIIFYDDMYFYKPAVAYSGASPIPERKLGFYQLIRSQHSHRDYPVSTFRRKLGEDLFGQLNIGTTKPVRKAALRDALIRIWVPPET